MVRRLRLWSSNRREKPDKSKKCVGFCSKVAAEGLAQQQAVTYGD